MAMAKPAIAFAVGGITEVVVHEKTGLLADAGDVTALAARMREIMTSRTALPVWGGAARARVVDRFSVEAMRAAYENLYESVAS
jgi:glycosyltransferase involved in cell wall biosynthesis